MGGYKAQGRDIASAKKLIRDAKLLEEAGAFAITLECVPADLATYITENISIPTIGIGAGKDCDGQVLVLQDLLGMSGFKPKFVKQYLDGMSLITNALNQYASDVATNEFPFAENISR